MARILSMGSSSEFKQEEQGENFFKKLWETFQSLDTSIKIFILFILLFTLTVPVVTKQYLDTRQRAQENKPLDQLKDSEKKQKLEYVKGEMIVKFKPFVENLELKGEAKASGLNLDSNPVNVADIEEKTTPRVLNELNKKYKLNKIEKVFKGRADLSASEISKEKRKTTEQELAKIDFSRTYKIAFDEKIPIELIMQEFIQSQDIEYAQPNYIYRINQVSSPSSVPISIVPTSTTTPTLSQSIVPTLYSTPTPGFSSPDDPYYLDSFPANVGNRDSSWNPSYDYQWDLKKIGMEQVWPMTSNFTEVKVAVVDTGVDYTHPEFGGCTLEQVNNNQCAKVLPGFDFVNNDNDPMDDYGHGTHVAGTIVATSNNNLGIAGMAPNAKIIPVKGLDNNGAGYLDKLAQAIIYSTDQGARVINASWGGLGSSSLLTEAISYAYFNGSVFVAAAGNDSSNVAQIMPANIKCRTQDNPDIDCVLTVASTDENDQRSYFSNWGTDIDVAAPGGGNSNNVISLKSQVIPDELVINIVGANYLRLRGTSMAAPHVSALASLVLGKDTFYTPLEVRNIILNGSDDLGSSSFDTDFGYGRINVLKTLTTLNTTTPPFASISLPQDTIAGSKFKIYGTAIGGNFLNYKIEYALDYNSNEWSNTGITLENSGNKPVGNSLLAIADLNETVTSGQYFLRLTTNTSSGKAFAIAKFMLDRSVRANFPIEYAGGTHNPIVFDLNGDGKKEIIFGKPRERTLNVIEPDGTNFAGWPKLITAADPDCKLFTSPVIGDIDSQYPGSEIIIPISRQEDCYWEGRHNSILLAFHADGTEVEGWTESSWVGKKGLYYYRDTLSTIGIDGQDAVVYLEQGPNNWWGWFDNLNLHVFGKNAQELPGWPVTIPKPNYYYYAAWHYGVNPVIKDINKDGRQEIIMGSATNLRIYSDKGELLTEIPTDDGIWNFTAADMDNDGFSEIIATSFAGTYLFQEENSAKIYVWDYLGRLKSSKWPFNITWQSNWFDFSRDPDMIPLTLTVGDFNNDGKLDILTKDGQKKYYLLDINANLLNGFPKDVAIRSYIFSNNITLEDKNKLIITHEITKPNLGLYLSSLQTYKYNFSSGSLTSFTGFPKNLEELWYWKENIGQPAIMDLDNDKKLELIVPLKFRYPNYFLYVFNLDTEASFSDWPQYLHDERHSGAYSSNPNIPTRLSLNFYLDGIGFKSRTYDNRNPVIGKRTLTLQVFDLNNNLLLEKTGEVNYLDTSGTFKGIIDLGYTLKTGTYNVKIRMEKYLKKAIKNIQINVNTDNTTSETALLPGDINLVKDQSGNTIVGDNKVNLTDYQTFYSCLSSTTVACINKADLNSDNRVNLSDYSLLMKNYGKMGD